jgi:hypothetical protein
MDFSVPLAFPMNEFRAFGISATSFFSDLMNHENLFDPLEKKRNFDWAWQAVRYRYRTCVESAGDFKSLLTSPSGVAWRAGSGDEELAYKLDRCIYEFFTNGLSIFDSFAFSLYFLGHAIRPGAFPDVANPRKITRRSTSTVFNTVFPQSVITTLLGQLSDDEAFRTIDMVRNLVGHRISGRRSVRSSTTQAGWYEETWHLPGANRQLIFDEELLHRYLDDITRLLTTWALAAQEFAESHKTATAQP